MEINLTQQINKTTGEHVLLIGHGSQDAMAVADYQRFAQQLAQRLDRPVQSCFLEFAEPPIVDGLRACVEAGAQRVIALPLFLGAATHQKNDVPTTLNWAKTQWPTVEFRYGVPLGVQPHIVNALAYNVEQVLATIQPVPLSETALIVVGRGSRDPDSNSEVSKIARLLYEGRTYGWVEVAFYDLTTPRIELMVERCVKLGARRIIVLSYVLFSGRIATRMAERVQSIQATYPETELLLGSPLGVSEHLVEAAVYRYEQVIEGVATMNCDVCKYRHRLRGFEHEVNQPQNSDHNHGLRGMAALLPPRYQNGNSVSAAPMVAAPLRYDAEGRVAWDQLWAMDETGSPFCELALAGGPPHRGVLLEPVLPAATSADPANYTRVLAELTRAIQMTTGLQTQLSAAPGWVGVRCYNEEMAIWLLRAIVVENVSVRREENILFLPAGPHFQLEQEIKNVVTALAKTHHYWQEHLRGQRQVRG